MENNHWNNSRWFPRTEGGELMSCRTVVIHRVVRTTRESKPAPKCVQWHFRTLGANKLPYASVFSGEKVTCTELRTRITWTSLQTATPEGRWCCWTFEIPKENNFQPRVLFLIKMTSKPEENKAIFHEIRKGALNETVKEEDRGCGK